MKSLITISLSLAFMILLTIIIHELIAPKDDAGYWYKEEIMPPLWKIESREVICFNR